METTITIAPILNFGAWTFTLTLGALLLVSSLIERSRTSLFLFLSFGFCIGSTLPQLPGNDLLVESLLHTFARSDLLSLAIQEIRSLDRHSNFLLGLASFFQILYVRGSSLKLGTHSQLNLLSGLGIISSLLLLLISVDSHIGTSIAHSLLFFVQLGFSRSYWIRFRAGDFAALWPTLAWLSSSLATGTLTALGVLNTSTAPQVLSLYAQGSPWGWILSQWHLYVLLMIGEIASLVQQTKRSVDTTQRHILELSHRDSIIQEYSNPAIVTEISLGIDPRKYEPKWVNRAILFSDMRDFTTLIENADLSTVNEILSTFIGEVVDCAVKHQGEVNKMIGDAVLCIFEHPQACLDATTALRHRLNTLNRDRVASGRVPIRLGSGISYSRVISMNIGRPGIKLDRTVIGDEVNIAARIEAMTRELFVDVLVTESFLKEVSSYPYHRPIGKFLLKGKTKLTTIYELFGHQSKRVVDYKMATKTQLEEVFHLFDETRFSEAIQIVDQLLRESPAHSFDSGAPLDRTLTVVKARIEAANADHQILMRRAA